MTKSAFEIQIKLFECFVTSYETELCNQSEFYLNTFPGRQDTLKQKFTSNISKWIGEAFNAIHLQ